MKRQTVGQTLKITGLVVIALVIAFLLFMGIGEMTSGDFSGVSHVIPAVVLIGLGALSLKMLRGGGLALAVVGLIIAGFFFFQSSDFQTRLLAIALTGGPVLLGGLLLLAASGVMEKPERA